ncbi:phosphatidylinositol phospholipase C [Histoplasma capsulatum G186AR]|uniref:Phosphatidylinositol phospholipase C n=2 Tax=Ajellomyces capsulatus TaxID=5037 RepID=C0NJN1_AJECG|nr:phosphatidylinositol phospholipase C [Histoplasma capsulatum G186AR]EEH08072.1 phosphatidylinositol phospholipase C [Histoplasma capsulatum G186AR]KAG5299602.1 phosphatidylinositol phospholipase C [Histoplasma capsulatum]QSS67772.1 phosphatidylinositol phospholipase C [Histoplasma capsulatum G186AR]
MVAEYLTVRNLTPTTLILNHVDRFLVLNVLKCDTKQVKNELKNSVTGSAAVADTSTQNSDPFVRQDVSIRIEPFHSVKTDIRAFDKSDKERLQLIFEAEGENHQIQITAPTLESATSKPLVDSPRFRFTGIYIIPESHLAIYPCANLNAWMREFTDETYLSALSIPGTHNSSAYHLAAPSVRCQAVSSREQLENGIRFFDIRVQPRFPNEPSEDKLLLVHGVFPISFSGPKYFRDLVSEVESFITENPSETLIMSVKREGPGNHTDEQLSRILWDHYAYDGSKWYTEPRVPTLGESRGKIVLIRRFGLEERLKKEWGGLGWGIDAEDLPDNTPFAVCPSGDLFIQDFYRVLDRTMIPRKIDYVNSQFERAAELRYPFGVIGKERVNNDDRGDHRVPFYINFLSASNFWNVTTWPEKIAARVNPAAVDYLCRKHHGKKGDWSTGIAVCDWVGLDGDWDLVRCIVGMNSRLMMQQR